MARKQPYQAIVTVTMTYKIDLAATDEEHAIDQIEQIEFTGKTPEDIELGDIELELVEQEHDDLFETYQH